MSNGCCRFHGGKAAVGPANGAYRHGGNSRYVPKALLADYERLKDDPNRLSLQHEIDILRLQHAEILKSMYAEAQSAAVAIKQAGTGLTAVRRAARLLRRAHQVQSEEAYANGLSALDEAIETIGTAFDPVTIRDEQRTKVVQLSLALDRLLRTENTVKLAERGMVSLEAVLARSQALIDAWKGALEIHVRDTALRTAVLTAVARHYTEFVGRRADSALDAGRPLVLDAVVAPPRDRPGTAGPR